MNRTELSVGKMLAAIEAPLYDVGVLSDRGMLPGLDGTPAEAVLAKLSLLKYRNARGSHIYMRPSGEHRYTVLDDLNEASLTKLSADGFDPCAVVETSVGNFQAWLKHAAVLPKLVGSLAAQLLARRYDADLSAAGWRRFGRLPGFTNCKPKYRKPDGLFPFVRLISHTGQQYPMSEAFQEEITRVLERAIAAYGKPQSIRSDNGPELTSRHYLAWAIEWKIDLVHIQPGKPTQNGAMESFNGKLRDECLNTSWFWNLFDARRKISAWKTEYNSRRPHSSLAYRPPDEFARQWQAASLSEAKSMTVDQPHQGDPDGLRFAPALTRLLHSQEIST